MKKLLTLGLVLTLSLGLFGCARSDKQTPPTTEKPPAQTEATEKDAAAGLVQEFGSRLQKVSLQAPADVLAKSMKEAYGDLVAPELLTKWAADPAHAPGRLTSSPWPDRIEIRSLEKAADGSYVAQGEVIEVTSVEKVSGGVAAKRPISVTVTKTGNNRLITAVTLGEYEQASGLTYRNTQFGFSFALPESWKGYQIVSGQWEGLAVGSGGEKPVQTGPLLSIRHPAWTAQNPRQDIPIMVFTIAQWNALQAGEFHIGAAPIGPSELGRNAKYVFALPARYNFAFPTGFEEVESILQSKPLRAFD